MNKDHVIGQVEKVIQPVYLVGGSVRDILLGREPKDWDFCTPKLPDAIEAKVKAAGRRPYVTGKRYGTVGFTIPSLDAKMKYQMIEVTTFRAEQYQKGSRKPSEVQFITDLKEDLSRRDFTINAIALRDGEYIDPFGGRLDLLARKIKSVGKATDRFKEDPLRMLRAARFASQLGFEIDPNMIGAIRKMPEAILDISRERWVAELDKLLMGDNYWEALVQLHESYLLTYMLPEVENLFKLGMNLYVFDAIETSGRTVEARWAALLQFIGLPLVLKERNGRFSATNYQKISQESVRGISLRLKWSNERTEKVQELIKQSRLTNF